ncbi:UNVERIFIED_CONTAM: hypothetical protein FKN15_068363 [Acipenser sinensis]
MPRPSLLLLLTLGCLCVGREEPLIGQGVGNAVGGAVPPAPGWGRSRMGGVLDSNPALVVMERRYVRQDWCKSQPLIQTLREEGCLSRTVVNRFCHGQCNSFYIPGGLDCQYRFRPRKTRRERRAAKNEGWQWIESERFQVGAVGEESGGGGLGGQGEEPFRSCAFCKPRLLSTVTVGFLCPGRSPPVKRRRLTLVKECRCTSIELH